MMHGETVRDMTNSRTTRELAGAIIEGEAGRNGWNKSEAAQKFMIGRQTLYRLYAGDATIQPYIFAKVERALELPRHIFDHLINGDTEAIETLDIDSDLKRVIVEGLTRTEVRRDA